MKSRLLHCCAIVAALVLLAGAALAADEKAEMVANPAYKNWSAFKPGTTVKIKETVTSKGGDVPGIVDATGAPEGPHERFIIYKLVSVSPEKCILEMTQIEMEQGSEVEHAPAKITYHAKIDKKYAGPGKDKHTDFNAGMDEVSAGGKMVKAHKVESTYKAGNETSINKVWYADDVPGGLIKSTTIKKEGNHVLYEAHRELVDLKIAK
jgi:hypothetical protein